MMLRNTLLLLTGLCLASAPAAGQDRGDANRGLGYAQRHCSVCHATGKDEWFSPNPDAPAFQQLANTSGVSWIALTAWLQRSHETMPDLVIPPHDREDVIAHILSLKTQ